MTDTVLRLVGVTQQYGSGATAVSALSGVDFEVRQGELVAVMGPSGSGKSTLLSIAGGLAIPTTGEVVIEGAYLSEQSPKQLARLRRRSLGFVFQDFNLIPTLTALENVTLPLELDGFRSRVARRAGRDALASDLAAYRAGAAVVADPRFVADGAIAVETYDGADQFEGRVPDNMFHRLPGMPPLADPVTSERVDAIVVDAPLQPVAIAIAPATAERLGMTTFPDRVIASTPEPLPQADHDRMQSQSEALSTPAYTIAPRVENGPPSDAPWVVPLLTAVSVLVLGASAVALGLARFERRPDDATLAAVGATRPLRRRINFWQGFIIAGFGTVAGALAGILPPIGFSIQSGGTQQLGDVPWWLIAVVAVALPLAIALANGIVPPRHPDLTRRTAIT